MQYILALLFTLTFCASANARYNLTLDNLPDIGDPANQVMSTREEYRIGQELITHIRRELPIVNDVELNYFVTNLGKKLLNQTGDTRFPFTFLILDSPIVNAFASPGGIIVVHTGLIELAESEEELAAVLGHEIAHVTQRHLARFYKKSNKVDIGTTLGILAAIIASAHSPTIGQAALYTGLAASASAKLAFTRGHEQEADRIGRQILSGAGYDPNAMNRFFERLQASTYTPEDSAYEYLSTHPLPSSRVADQFTLPNKNSAENHTNKNSNSLEYDIFRARTNGLSLALSEHEIIDTNKRDSIIYARAVSLAKTNRSKDALKLTQSLSRDWKKSFSGRLLRGVLLAQSGKPQKSISLLEALVENHPEHPSAKEALASVYLSTDQAQKAYYLLNQSDADTHQWLPLLKLKADAASKSDRQAISHATMAIYYEKVGLPSAALEQIEIAEQLPTTSNITKARLDLLRTKLKKASKKETATP